jgi:hypothetical protein
MGQDAGISDREIGFWITPPKALALAVGQSNEVATLTTAAKELLRRMGLGIIAVRAKKTLVELNGARSDLGPNRLVHSQVLRIWEAFPRPLTLPIWEKSGMKVPVADGEGLPGTARIYDLIGLRLDPKGVNDLLDDLGATDWGRPHVPLPEGGTAWPSPGNAPLTPPKHAGGAPPKDIWESVWVDIAARLISGDLDPKQQKDIVNAMLDWAVANNETIAEATAKRHAKLLWDKVKSGS